MGLPVFVIASATGDALKRQIIWNKLLPLTVAVHSFRKSTERGR